jgi:hypothetical protein
MKLYNFNDRSMWTNPWGLSVSETVSDIEPGASDYAVEVWERVTRGGWVVFPNVHDVVNMAESVNMKERVGVK